MRHNRDEKRFDRTYSHLRSMLSNMTNDMVMYGRIRTTTQKAKVLRSYVEKMITLGKDGGLSARRRAFAFMKSKAAVTRLFETIAPLFKERNGGYTRILKVGNRPGDNAMMSIIELVEGPQAAQEAAAPKKKAVKKAAAPAAEKKAPAKAKKEAAPKKAAAPRKPKAAAAEGETEAKPAVKRTRKKATESEA